MGGVAFSVLLMILLQGLNIGYTNIIGQYFKKVPADLWVARANTGNIMDPSFLPLSMRAQLESVDGVADVEPFGMQSLSTRVRGKDLPMYLISSDSDTDAGKPTSVSTGKKTPAKGEVIIDRITAESNNIRLGDSIPFAERRLKVVGFSEGTYLLSTSFAFFNRQDAGDIYSVPNTTNYWLIQLKPGANVESVQAAINSQFPQANAHTRAHFIQVNIDIVKNIVQPVFRALVVLGALIGTAIIGLTIFTSTIEKSREFGVLKALGLKNRQLYIVVMQQALITTTIGYAIGALLALTLKGEITNTVPQFITQIRAFDFGWIFAVTILMAIVASYTPMRRLNKIDPAEVFRS